MRNRFVLAALVVGASLALAVAIEQRWRAADDARQSWGELMTVAVVSEPVGAGQMVGDAVALVERPAAMVPADATTSLPAGTRAAVDLVPGEIVLAGRLIGRGDDSLPAGTVAVTVDVADTAPHVAKGDIVDLWSVDAAGTEALRIVEAVVVLGRGDEQLTVAVPESEMAAVAVAAGSTLTVARR